MKIAVIGAGSVGGTLGRRWAELGHAVCFGIRNVEDADAKALVGKIKGDARLASVRDAAKDADVVVLATPYAANPAAIAAAGDLSGKILIDVTNPIGPNFSLAVGFNSSGGEEVAKLAPRAKVYKAMNQVGFEVMANPAFAAGKPVMFVAGDDAAGKTGSNSSRARSRPIACGELDRSLLGDQSVLRFNRIGSGRSFSAS